MAHELCIADALSRNGYSDEMVKLSQLLIPLEVAAEHQKPKTDVDTPSGFDTLANDLANIASIPYALESDTHPLEDVNFQNLQNLLHVIEPARPAGFELQPDKAQQDKKKCVCQCKKT